MQPVTKTTSRAEKAYYSAVELYLLHVLHCRTCLVQGKQVDFEQRCATGKELWNDIELLGDIYIHSTPERESSHA